MLTFAPLTGTFGARVENFDVGRPIDGAAADELGAALRQYRVLVFPEQTAVGPAELLTFAEQFGVAETAEHPNHQSWPDLPAVKVLVSDGPAATYVPSGDTWHTDGSQRENRAWISFLQAVDIPPYGRDTVFADMVSVYRDLSDTLKAMLEGKSALHSWGRQKPDEPPVTHPIVLADGDGRRSVYVNRAYTREIVGLPTAESDLILSHIFEQVHLPQHQLRVAWNMGTIVVWDNERTQHSLVFDYPYRRVMHRVMVTPEPVSSIA
jgi:taurine dioxygenase